VIWRQRAGPGATPVAVEADVLGKQIPEMFLKGVQKRLNLQLHWLVLRFNVFNRFRQTIG